MTLFPRLRVRTRLGTASLRTRVMIAAAGLVTITSAVTGRLGTTLLRSYLFDRTDAPPRSLTAAAGGLRKIAVGRNVITRLVR